MNNQTADLVLTSVRNRIVAVFPAQIRAAIAVLTDEQLWWRPNEKSNSVANLVLHLSGSLNHYLNHLIGRIPYERDRAKEFSERDVMSRDELLAIFDDMVAKASKTLASIDVSRLDEPATEPKMHTIFLEDLLSIVIHVSTHTGQILWIAKALKEGGLNDVWIQSHREHGGWNPAR